MDNLELLKKLPDNSIDLIYNDILYNTGKKFKDFTDKLGTPKQAIEWYKPRIIEMHRVLKSTGSIYIHCDTHLSHYIKILMDDIFGIDKFRNDIIWRYKRWTAKSETKYQCMHDNILFYVKDQNKIYHQYELLNKPHMYQNRKDKNGDVIKDQNGNVIYFPQTERQIDDVWDIPFLNPRAKERVQYDTQKPEELLKRIILASSNEGDIIADFFCGSGTSLVVAKKLGRNYLGCDINKRAIEITEKRLNEVK